LSLSCFTASFPASAAKESFIELFDTFCKLSASLVGPGNNDKGSVLLSLFSSVPVSVFECPSS